METQTITKLTQSEVRDLFRYDRKNGGLYWKKQTNKYMKPFLIGERFGCVNDKTGYPRHAFRKGKVYGLQFQEHQLVYLYHHGWIPPRIIHRNGDLTDNRIGNLEQVDENIRR